MNSARRFIGGKNMAVRTISIILIAIMLVVVMSQTAMAKNTYVITDGNRVVVHTTNATDPARVLNEAGLQLSEADSYIAQNANGMSEIKVCRSHTVTINNCGMIQEIISPGESVEELLNRADIDVTGNVTISADLNDSTYNGMVITISRSTDVEETYTVKVPYEVEYVYDDTAEEGTLTLLQEGSDGEAVCTGIVCYTNGFETKRTVVSESIVTEPVNQVISIGTAPVVETLSCDIYEGQIVLSNGEVLNYTGRIDVLATAYTCEGWSSVGITATGTVARVGEIAVDPSIIPLGSKLFIKSSDGEYIYGVAYAEDTGGLINGYRIDLYYDTEYECIQFGARMCEVYFIN